MEANAQSYNLSNGDNNLFFRLFADICFTGYETPNEKQVCRDAGMIRM